MTNAVLDGDTGDLLDYQHLIRQPNFQEAWGEFNGVELGLLDQGIPVRIDDTNTIVFIHKQAIISDQFKDVTYGNIICDYKENE